MLIGCQQGASIGVRPLQPLLLIDMTIRIDFSRYARETGIPILHSTNMNAAP